MKVLTDPRVQLLVGLIVSAALAIELVRRLLRRWSSDLHTDAVDEQQHVIADLLRCTIAPLVLLLWCAGVFALGRGSLIARDFPEQHDWLAPLLEHAGLIGMLLAFVWLSGRASRVLERRLRTIASRTAGHVDDILLPLLMTAVRVFVPIFGAFLVVRMWPVAPEILAAVRQLLAIALILAIAWILRRGILLTDAALLGAQASAPAADRRAMFTRVRLLRRIALALVTTFAVAAVLMTFDEVRDVGRSILASAGIAGIVLGLAAQRSLGNLFAGIQLALTQPIRLGDQVLVEGDVGNIEEITLTYVVVRVWDARRIVLPITYFIEKPFQNWTRVATNMLSPLTIRFDFSLPVDALRAYLEKEIARSPFWDKTVFSVQVTASDDRTMEVRVLASAADSGASFNLQCELREKAIAFVRDHHPTALPKVRQDQRRVEGV